MKITLNFKCSSCELEYERRIDSDTQTIECECGSDAVRQVSAPKFAGNSCGKNASWSKKIIKGVN